MLNPNKTISKPFLYVGLYIFLCFSAVAPTEAFPDFDYDGKADFCVFRPSERIWYSHPTEYNASSSFQWGLASDVSVPADYDGDRKTDFAVYRSGTWFILDSSAHRFRAFYYGLATDTPLASTHVKPSIVSVP